MTNRERVLAVLDHRSCDRLPVLHFGFLASTLRRWAREGHLRDEEIGGVWDGSPGEDALAARLGFDANYYHSFEPRTRLDPPFAAKVLETLPDGHRKELTGDGVVVLTGEGLDGIPSEIEHLLKGRAEWAELYRPRLLYHPRRVEAAPVNCAGVLRAFAEGGLEHLRRPDRPEHVLLHCGSLYGALRDYAGLTGLCYLLADDEGLVDEMIEVNAELCRRCAEAALASGARFDIGHFWEDIAFKNGPLVHPAVLSAKAGPHYRRIAGMLRERGIPLVSLDCDGCIDELIPVWFDCGINVMFPIEVGTWGASIAPWRRRFGPELRGVGGMDKRVFARDYAAVDAEIERLQPLVALGGYIPCPDHRIPPDARWENVQYYCERMRAAFG